MKRILAAFLAAMFVLIISCTPAQKEVISPAVNEPAKETGAQPAAQEVSSDVAELLSKHKAKVQSIYYKYNGPETGIKLHEFYVKENRIKYIPAREIQSLDTQDSFDSIFIDKIGLTAKSFCVAAFCKYPGFKANLDFEKYYIQTTLDWLSGITQAKKVGEEVIDDRNTWKIETNKGILWVDVFYGVPLKVEANGNTYRYQQISVNRVKDSDVVPS